MQSVTLSLLVLATSFQLCDAVRFEAARAELLKRTLERAGSKDSLDAVMRRTTLASAVETLRKRNHSVFLQLNLASRSQFLGLRHKDATKAVAKLAQTPSADQAKAILTEMIEETMKKLDMEQTRCSDYYIAQEAAIKETKDAINGFNAASARARSEILAAEESIEHAEKMIPILEKQLEDHEKSCAEDLAYLNEQLKVALADQHIMDTILNNTPCTSTSMTYPASFLQCVDESNPNAEAFITFRERKMRVKVSQLRQTSVRQAVLQSFVQVSHARNGSTAMYTLAPTVPPAEKKKVQHKCAMSNMTNCFLLRDKFMQIASELKEKVENLQTVLAHKQGTCEATTTQFDVEIEGFKTQLRTAQTAFAEATAKQNEADRSSRNHNNKLKELEKEYAEEVKRCMKNIAAFEGDICALNKIRRQVLELESGTVDPKFEVVDCSVSKWTAEPCSITCGGQGVHWIRRQVLVPPRNGGAPCGATERQAYCHTNGCPVDCMQEEWSEWTTCSAMCGGGLRERNRETITEGANGGKACGAVVDTQGCGTPSCDKDCDLSLWSQWSECSKQCNGGTSTRIRDIDVPAAGDGECAEPHDDTRFNVRSCNMEACEPETDTLQCNTTKMDVILVLDASGSLRQEGWDATKAWAKKLVAAFGPTDTRIAVQTFSGARSYTTTRRCATNPNYYNLSPADCGIFWIQHWSSDQAAILQSIDTAVWTRSFTLMSLAISNADVELSSSRRDANSIVIVVTDGRPMSRGKTSQAAARIRKKTRLMFVPVTRYAPINDIKRWASHPVRENVIQVPDFATLEKPEVVSSIVANACINVK